MLRVTSELLTWRRVETQPQNNLETLETQLAKVTSERDEYAQLARLLREELERVKRGLMGPSRERFVADGQLSLAVLATALEASTQAAPPNEEPAVVVPSSRTPLPWHHLGCHRCRDGHKRCAHPLPGSPHTP